MIVNFAKYIKFINMLVIEQNPLSLQLDVFYVKKGYHYNKLLGCTLIFAREVCMTDLKHYSINGTYKKENKMKKDEYKEEQKKKSNTDEAPFETLKIFYNINQIPSIGKHHTRNTRSILNNIQLKRIYNKQRQIHDETTK